jgi:probable HAF family extracellular repeat protein
MKIPKRTFAFVSQTFGVVVLSGLIGRTPVLAEPVFTGVGDLSGGSFMSRANGVSADGTTVVGASRSVAGLEAFRWTANEGMIGLGFLPGGAYQSEAFDVSGDGSVIVGYNSPAMGQPYEAFRWEAGAMSGLGDLPGGSFYSMATAVSADGLVIVGRGSSEQWGEAFRWTDSSGLVGLGNLPSGSNYSQATAVSADGSVVVGYGSNTGDETSEAFRWTSSTGIVGLGFLPGGSFGSYANAVSSDGMVVAGTSDSEAGVLAYRWTQEAGMIALGDFSIRSMSADASTIVGSGYYSGDYQAIIWDEANGLRGLHELLEVDLGLDLGSWTLDEARDISADGTVIVGTGTNPLGQTEGWIAVVPEPTSLVLLGVYAWVLPRQRPLGRRAMSPGCHCRSPRGSSSNPPSSVWPTWDHFLLEIHRRHQRRPRYRPS